MNKNIFSVFLVLIILLVFPFVSYKYLKDGATFRRNSLNELENFGPISNFSLQLDSEKILNKDSIISKVWFISFCKPTLLPSFRTNLLTLYDQFKDRSDYHFLLIDTFSSAIDFPIIKNGATFSHLKCNDLASMNLISNQFTLTKSGFDMLITDVKGNIRNVYFADSIDCFKKIVNHTTILLPLEKKAAPLLTRDKEK